MMQQHAPAARPRRRRSMDLAGWVRRRAAWLVWGALALVILSGLDQIWADPDHLTPGMTAPIVLSEFSATGHGLTDEQLAAAGGTLADAPDWIELHNRSRLPLSLAGWTLSDDPAQPVKWTLPDIQLRSGGYLLVLASGRDRTTLRDDSPFLHTNFRLAADGGFLALYPPSARRYLDATVYEYPAQRAGMSYGLVEVDGAVTPRFLGTPTPAAENIAAPSWAAALAPVEVSHASGFMDRPISVALSHPTPGVEIRYRTDGGTPTADTGTLYAGPIAITQTTPLVAVAFLADHLPSHPTGATYLYMDEVVTQPPDPAGWPSTWGTHRIDMGPYRGGAPVEAVYGMDAAVAADPVDGPRLRDGLAALPSLLLTLDVDDFDIYADPQTRGRDMERAVLVELLDPSGDEAGFAANAGVRIQGGAGRWEFMPKHSFRLFFRREYGASSLAYPLFAPSPVTSFQTVVLRAGSDESFVGHPPMPDKPVDFRDMTYLRDEWARASQLAQAGVGVRGRFVHLYINGLYWGVYNAVERPDADYAAAHFGGDVSAWSSVSHSGAVDGTLDRFHVLLQLAQAGGLSDPAAYDTFLEFLDPAQFSDYVILNWFAGNDDWPENNWYVVVQNPAGRNLFLMWDGESTWTDGAAIRLGSDGWEGAPYPNVVKAVFEAAWENPDFRLTFADRLVANLTGDGPLTDAAAQARWRSLQATLDPAIMGEVARWGAVRVDPPVRYADWLAANERVLAQMEGNAAKLLQLAQAAGYLPELPAPTIAPTGGDFDDGVTVTLATTAGEVFYTLDGSDPRERHSGAPSSTAARYDGPFTLTTTGSVLARSRAGDTWGPLRRADFAKRGEVERLAITEIMALPPDDAEMEFLELKNIGDVTIDLSGAYFDGIDLRFRDGQRVAPGEHVLLVRNLRKFRERYGDAPEVHGVYGGRLSNRGETITLYRRDGSLWVQATYGVGAGWPMSTARAGDSLVAIDPAGDLNDPANWRASTVLYGTPGADEAVGE